MVDLTPVDDLAPVRELTADTPPLTADARAAAHARLLGVIAQETRRRGSAALPRRLMLFAAAGATAAAAVAGTAVVTRVGGARTGSPTGSRPRATPLDAPTELRKAAERARSSPLTLPIPRNDQYMYTRTYEKHTFDKDGSVTHWVNEWWLSVDNSKPSREVLFGTVVNEPPHARRELVAPIEYAQLERWPTDPDMLLKRFRGAPYDADIPIDLLFLLLTEPRVLPPGLKAAAFEALAELPGLAARYDDADAFGRRGIALSCPVKGKTGRVYVFDLETSDFLGWRERNDLPDNRRELNHLWQPEWHLETTSREVLGVVDRIGQRPQLVAHQGTQHVTGG